MRSGREGRNVWENEVCRVRKVEREDRERDVVMYFSFFIYPKNIRRYFGKSQGQKKNDSKIKIRTL